MDTAPSTAVAGALPVALPDAPLGVPRCVDWITGFEVNAGAGAGAAVCARAAAAGVDPVAWGCRGALDRGAVVPEEPAARAVADADAEGTPAVATGALPACG